VTFKVITGKQVPDYNAIAWFYRNFKEELSELFIEMLWLCGCAELVKRGMVIVASTKMTQNPSPFAKHT